MQTKVRMDRGRDHATVHGERGPGDTHAAVHFYQDGLPFDAQGYLILDHPDFEPENGNKPSPRAQKLRDIAERKLKKASKLKPAVEASETGEPSDDEDLDDDNDDGDGGDEPVNLEAWLRGEQDIMWHIISQTIAQRYKRRVQNLPDAVTFLVKEGVVSPDLVARKYQKHLD